MEMITATVTLYDLLHHATGVSDTERTEIITALVRDCLSMPPESAACVRDQMRFDFWSGLLKVDQENEAPEEFAKRLSAAWDGYFTPVSVTTLQ